MRRDFRPHGVSSPTLPRRSTPVSRGKNFLNGFPGMPGYHDVVFLYAAGSFTPPEEANHHSGSESRQGSHRLPERASPLSEVENPFMG